MYEDDDDIIGLDNGELGCAIHLVPLNAFDECEDCKAELQYDEWEEASIEAFKSRKR